MPDEPNLKIAFCLFAYRPFGGLQRDFYRIAQICAGRDHSVDVYTMEWQGEIPGNLNVHVLPVNVAFCFGSSAYACTGIHQRRRISKFGSAVASTEGR